MIIECTKKLADAMKIKLNAYDHNKEDSFYEWHANLFMFDRRKGILIMNNKTRYCIVLYGVKMEHLRKLDQIVLDSIKETFIAEGFSEDIVDKYMDKCGGKVDFIKTHDRSVLGQMKDFYISISWQIEEHLPSKNINLIELNQWVGRSLMCGSLGYANPINLLRKELERMD